MLLGCQINLKQTNNGCLHLKLVFFFKIKLKFLKCYTAAPILVVGGVVVTSGVCVWLARRAIFSENVRAIKMADQKTKIFNFNIYKIFY